MLFSSLDYGAVSTQARIKRPCSPAASPSSPAANSSSINTSFTSSPVPNSASTNPSTRASSASTTAASHSVRGTDSNNLILADTHPGVAPTNHYKRHAGTRKSGLRWAPSVPNPFSSKEPSTPKISPSGPTPARAFNVDPGYFKDCSNAVLLSSRGGTQFDRTFLDAFLRSGLGIANWVSRSNYPALNVLPPPGRTKCPSTSFRTTANPPSTFAAIPSASKASPPCTPATQEAK